MYVIVFVISMIMCYCFFGAIDRKLMAESDDDDKVEEYDSDGDLETSRKLFFKKAKGNKKKKPGRKAKWCPWALDELIDMIVSSNSCKKKLIVTNTKNQRNGELYGEILKEDKPTASARGENFCFSVNQLRSKFKKCVCPCKQTTLTQKKQQLGSNDFKRIKDLASGSLLFLK